MKVRVRPLRAGDYEAMMGLWRAAGLPVSPRGRDTMDRIAAQIEAMGDLYLGAFHQERLVGVVLGNWDGRRGWINHLAVDPAYQGQGIATLLVRRVEEALRQRGALIVSTLIEADNETSLAIFRKMGYEFPAIRYGRKKFDPEA
jgi:ribosomal protein S18 acetylase RimI-like enzyme